MFTSSPPGRETSRNTGADQAPVHSSHRGSRFLFRLTTVLGAMAVGAFLDHRYRVMDRIELALQPRREPDGTPIPDSDRFTSRTQEVKI